MKEILIVDLKISLALAAFFAVYKLAFGNDTFFVRNRWFFLVAIVVSFTAPWLKFVNKVYVNTPSVNYSPDIINTSPTVTVTPFNVWSVVLNVILVVYLLGVLFYMTRFALAYHKVIRLIIKSERKKFQELILVITRLSVTPFSLFKWLVVPKHQVDHPEFENIVQHESIHCRQYHSVDLFLAELMIVFQWFNPFAWWLKRSMVENHEFIVDREILQHGVDSRKYQYLLLNLSTGSNQLAGVNYFNTNLLKKRIRMINKTKSPRWYGLKNGMILISIVATVALTATFETEVVAQNTETGPLVVINGKKSDNKTLKSINPDRIQMIHVLKDSASIAKYGKDGKNGIIEVTLNDTMVAHSFGNTEGVTIVSHANRNSSNEFTNEKIKIRAVSHKLNDSTTISHEAAEDKEEAYQFVEEPASFQGGDVNTFRNWVQSNIIYPKAAVEAGIIGKVLVQFAINSKGKLVDAKVLRGVHPELDKEAIRVILTSPTWVPGKKDGRAVKQDFVIPIIFQLNDTKQNEKPLFIVDDKIVPDFDFSKINPGNIDKIQIWKNGAEAIEKYGEKGKNGVVVITLKGYEYKEVETTKTEDKSVSNSILFTPNPTSKNVEVTLKGSKNSGMFDVKIYDKFGKLLSQDKKAGPTFTLSVSDFATDNYFVVVSSGDNIYKGNLSVVH